MNMLDYFFKQQGVEQIIKELRPYAKYRLENTVFTKWDDLPCPIFFWC
jgi:hypothetical protein